MTDTRACSWQFIGGNALKLIAVVSMLTDHIGAALFPQFIWMRIAGRIAFPIFCFLLTEGSVYTHDILKYMGRLALFAVISEVPFDLALHGKLVDLRYQNVFITLLIGLAVIYADRNLRKRAAAGTERYVIDFLLLIAGCCLAFALRADYSWYGVAIIFSFYFFRKYRTVKYLLVSALCVMMGGIEIYAILALIPITLYGGMRKRLPSVLKLAFYAFYPAHLAVIAVFRFMMT